MDYLTTKQLKDFLQLLIFMRSFLPERYCMNKQFLLGAWIAFFIIPAYAEEHVHIVGDELIRFMGTSFAVTRHGGNLTNRIQFKSDGTAYQNLDVSGKPKSNTGAWKINEEKTNVCVSWNTLGGKGSCFGYYRDGGNVTMYSESKNNPIVFGTIER